ncbi:MAG: cyclic pyranopterin monophosphate synthase MoaC [Rhodothermaceae bacterium]|nr:cyclic pyranopterin monophosphate synthase MoaC [Rhodothermaceae bacterium]MXZ58794.1 cyclic pyranopterin monophosphate synthase MoaC [Rhodothermaceae bacterium]MYB92199.1 cyclic pyranopterin monophosphate synthase MoaC [Rhodothermaceae bacterium]MYD67297.1 cyclic pyranopterin monophosphate synthase MoaC [Rhodothermaceae bacterium]MYG44744.1 cyclic pyranopterin monophosphate synthase MoaC [Rhodothermaceae bacterium]
MPEFTHLEDEGGIHMVDVSRKPSSTRSASAEGVIQLGVDAYTALTQKRIAKGDVLTTAQLAGIMGAKDTARLIPLCHPIPLDSVVLSFSFDEKTHAVKIQAKVTSCGRTGVEMEALTAVSIASLSIYDMCKSISKAIRITDIRLVSKEGGVRGRYSVDSTP